MLVEPLELLALVVLKSNSSASFPSAFDIQHFSITYQINPITTHLPKGGTFLHFLASIILIAPTFLGGFLEGLVPNHLSWPIEAVATEDCPQDLCAKRLLAPVHHPKPTNPDGSRRSPPPHPNPPHPSVAPGFSRASRSAPTNGWRPGRAAAAGRNRESRLLCRGVKTVSSVTGR